MPEGKAVPDEWFDVHVPDVMHWHIRRLDDAGVAFPDGATSRDEKETVLYRLLMDQYGTCACGEVGPDLSLVTVAFDPDTKQILAWACCECFPQLGKLRKYASALRARRESNGFAAQDAGAGVVVPPKRQAG